MSNEPKYGVWQGMDSAPKDNTIVLIWTGFDVVAGRYNSYTFDDFLGICEEGEGISEYEEHMRFLEEDETDPTSAPNQWLFASLEPTESVLGADALKWMPLPPAPTREGE